MGEDPALQSAYIFKFSKEHGEFTLAHKYLKSLLLSTLRNLSQYAGLLLLEPPGIPLKTLVIKNKAKASPKP
jgi:hypothetical protein